MFQPLRLGYMAQREVKGKDWMCATVLATTHRICSLKSELATVLATTRRVCSLKSELPVVQMVQAGAVTMEEGLQGSAEDLRREGKGLVPQRAVRRQSACARAPLRQAASSLGTIPWCASQTSADAASARTRVSLFEANSSDCSEPPAHAEDASSSSSSSDVSELKLVSSSSATLPLAPVLRTSSAFSSGPSSPAWASGRSFRRGRVGSEVERWSPTSFGHSSASASTKVFLMMQLPSSACANCARPFENWPTGTGAASRRGASTIAMACRRVAQ
mmetsp:Transcript_1697/g.5293  ORF Transcript_1697/g.5293 Transcript_1697/m.5293 type:complete len:275 (-) Transcript_1697:49-873(-)